jgi:hypothetical protein
MKIRSLCITMLLLVSSALSAQFGINSDNSSPDPSAMLDVKSTSKGFLPPRMTTAQRDLIVSPASGLTVYNITYNRNETYSGSSWVGNMHYIGENYGGGIVFYVYDKGQHGLIAATADQSAGIRWEGGTWENTRARADGIGAGIKNTSIIIANQGAIDGAAFAATVCNEFSVTEGGVTYDGWYLPSLYELNLLYLQKNLVGSFVIDIYWSSTERNETTAYLKSFNSGSTIYASKGGSFLVRAIRAF